MKGSLALLVFFLSLTISAQLEERLKESNPKCNTKKNERNLLIVNTIDGSIRALDENDGSVVWKVDGDPHVSQSITKIEYRKDDGKSYRLVPSLEGALYLVEPKVMRPLPFTAGDLLAQRNNIVDNSMVVGAQETDITVINTETGNIVFNCSKDGCANWNTSTEDGGVDPGLRLIVHRRRHTVRSVDLRTGAEKWNLSVSQNEIRSDDSVDAAIPIQGSNNQWKRSNDQKNAHNDRIIEYTFNVQGGIILATTHNPFSSILWQAKLGASLHKVWSLRAGQLQPVQIITPGQPLTSSVIKPTSNSRTGKSTDTSHAAKTAVGEATCTKKKGGDFPFSKTKTEETHFIYFGHFNGQLYVQLDDISAIRHSVPIPPEPTHDLIPEVDGDGELTVVRPPRVQPPPTGFYQSAKAAMITLGGEEDGESMSVEAYGQAGNPMSWWFQSLMLGLFIFVVVHLIVTRALNAQHAKTPLLPVSVQTLDEEIRADNESAEVQTAPTTKPEPERQSETQGTASSGIGGTLASTPSSSLPSGDQLSSTASVAPFESRYLSEYTHERCLGKGGFGVVFEARNKLDDTEYAIKRVCVRDKDDNFERLCREVKALARLEHPGIVRYYMAWIERPPPGWQEERDKELNLCEPCKGTDGLVTFGDLEETSTNVTNANIQSSSYAPSHFKYRKKYSDSDVEIIFQSKTESLERQLGLDNSERGRNLSRISSDPNETSGNEIESESSSSMPPRRRFFVSTPADDSPEIIFQRSGESKQSSIPESVNADLDLSELKAEKCSSSKQNVSMIYLYIAMELCAVESLKTWLENTINNRPSRDHLLNMFAQMVDTVSYVHRSELMHRDLKPSNIFFSRSDGRMIKIGDFGLVTSIAEENMIFARNTSVSGSLDSSISSDDAEGTTSTGQQKRNRPAPGQNRWRHTDRVGTRLYMSPELEAGREYDTKVDIFSLGLILLELLLPFGTQMERVHSLQQAKKGILPKYFVESHPDEAELIQRLLSSDPASRPSCVKILEEPLIRNAYQDNFRSRYRNSSMSAPPEDME